MTRRPEFCLLLLLRSKLDVVVRLSVPIAAHTDLIDMTDERIINGRSFLG